MAKTYYLHTINGLPAEFSKSNRQIVHASHYGPAARLVVSLEQIRKEQAITRANRKSWGMGPEAEDKYAYKRVRLP